MSSDGCAPASMANATTNATNTDKDEHSQQPQRQLPVQPPPTPASRSAGLSSSQACELDQLRATIARQEQQIAQLLESQAQRQSENSRLHQGVLSLQQDLMCLMNIVEMQMQIPPTQQQPMLWNPQNYMQHPAAQYPQSAWTLSPQPLPLQSTTPPPPPEHQRASINLQLDPAAKSKQQIGLYANGSISDKELSYLQG